MGGLFYPPGPCIGELIIYEDSPEIRAQVAELELELAKEKAKPPKVVINTVHVPVEREVPDPKLLEQINRVLKENAELKKKSGQVKYIDRVVDRPIETVVEQIREITARNRKLEAAIAIGFLLLGAIIGRLTHG
jgi:hypothetical protein